MTKKDDEKAGATPPALPRKNVTVGITGVSSGSTSATMSATAAILSVTSNNMRADLNAFWAQFNQLPPIEQKALAKGTVTAENLGIKTKLPTDMTKGMANLRSLDDELKERRGHDEKLAKINASGQANAEIVKWVLWAVATIVLVTATYFLRGP